MNEIKGILDRLVFSNDIASIDVILTFAYISNKISESGLKACRSLIEAISRKVAGYNLKLKHELSEREYEEKLKIIDELYLQSYVTFHELKTLLPIIESTVNNLLQKDAKNRLKASNELERKIALFVLRSLPKIVKLEEGIHEYYLENDRVKELTLTFNRMFRETLLAKNVLSELGYDMSRHVFWELGDTVVKLGLGYWTPFVSGSGNVSVNLSIPKFLYEVMKLNEYLLPKIEDFDKRFEETYKMLRESRIDEEIHEIFLAKIREHVEIKSYEVPIIRKPVCENDLYFLIGRYWNIIKEKIGLENIVFVDKHWDAEGIYKGRKVRIEIKLDAGDFDKDPAKIDLLICWKITPSKIINRVLRSEEMKKCLRKLNSHANHTRDFVKELFRCLGIEVIELSEILKAKISENLLRS